MKDTAAMPKIPRPTTTAKTIKMTFRALPLFGAGGSGVAAAAGEEGVADVDLPTGWVAPHLVQNFAPPSRVAPQELQNAIKFASRPIIFALTAEYIASWPHHAWPLGASTKAAGSSSLPGSNPAAA